MKCSRGYAVISGPLRVGTKVRQKSFQIENPLYSSQKEKGSMRIAAFQPLSLNEYPGYLSSIVFTQGCNFKCDFCHNPELKQTAFKETFLRKKLLTEDVILEDLIRLSGKVDAVTVTGGEPLIQKGLLSFMGRLKRMGFKVKLNTNGSVFKVLSSVVNKGLVDLINMDIKAPQGKYKKACGGATINIDDIENSISLIKNCGVDYIFSTVLHDGLSSNDISHIKKWVGSNNLELRENLI